MMIWLKSRWPNSVTNDRRGKNNAKRMLNRELWDFYSVQKFYFFSLPLQLKDIGLIINLQRHARCVTDLLHRETLFPNDMIIENVLSKITRGAISKIPRHRYAVLYIRCGVIDTQWSVHNDHCRKTQFRALIFLTVSYSLQNLLNRERLTSRIHEFFMSHLWSPKFRRF